MNGLIPAIIQNADTGKASCFSNSNSTEEDSLRVLFATILDRQKTMPKGSYTASLFAEGLDQICAKVEEESGEVIQAAKRETKQRLIEESADLIYHLFVLMVSQDVGLDEVGRELRRRQR
ncbi:phosphoribosyl-ATP diphosphatase [Candidatus Peregrinibacteria bacterium]|nr:phosphoribosyl-ATP diphosphatase [Candidatus Peregrinibacteria bacterium]